MAGLFIGFALVKKFIPATLNSNTQFTDFYPEYNYVKEVQNIANRFIVWMESSFPHKWQLRNLCADRCVIGKCNQTNPGFCGSHPQDFDTNGNSPPNPTDEDPCPETFSNQCSEGGALAKPGAIGFIAANEFIQGQPSITLQGLIGNGIYRGLWDFDINPLNPLIELSIWKYSLVAIGGVGDFTEVTPWPLQIIIADSPKNIDKNTYTEYDKKFFMAALF